MPKIRKEASKENKENVDKFESSRRNYEQSMKSKLKTFASRNPTTLNARLRVT